jgi:signal transduction histidine kinase
MERSDSNTDENELIRQKAEELLGKQKSKVVAKHSDMDTVKLIHELEVHQIELTMQNEELKQAKAIADELAQKYIELYNSSPIGYLTLTNQGQIVEINLCGAQMLCKKPSALISSHFGFFISNETKPIFNQFLSNVFSSHIKESCEVILEPIDCEPLHVQLTGIVSAKGGNCRVNIIDITAQRMTEKAIIQINEELTKHNAEKDLLLSILAHDLRSPFSAFLGLTEILEKKLCHLKQERVYTIATSLREAAKGVFDLVENLLEWAKMQRGLIEFKPETVNLDFIIKSSLESILATATQKKLKIELNIPENLIVEVDSIMFNSTFRNLISNAIKFSNRGSIIFVSARKISDHQIEIAITDMGIGISPELISQLFSVNCNTGRCGTEGERSTGLGLLLCKDFIERHNGKLWVESVEGEGSTFYFTVPMA